MAMYGAAPVGPASSKAGPTNKSAIRPGSTARPFNRARLLAIRLRAMLEVTVAFPAGERTASKTEFEHSSSLQTRPHVSGYGIPFPFIEKAVAVRARSTKPGHPRPGT